MAVTINLKSVAQKVAGSRALVRKSKNAIQKKVKKNVKQALREFDTHPVTQEILGGKQASNISGTLEGKGNLFTFIGFTDGSRPTADVRKTLQNTVKFVKQKAVVKSRGRVKLDSKIKAPSPTLIDFDAAAPLPRQGGSWVKGIEYGINGFGSYIYWREAGYSGGGLQAKSKDGKEQILRMGAYQPTRYLSIVVENLIKNIKSNKDFRIGRK